MSAAGNLAPSTLTAERIAEGSKTFVVVYLDGVELARAGGKRAERATAAIVTQWGTRAPGIYGLRADAEAASAEAARLSTSRPLTHCGQRMRAADGTPLWTNPAEWAVVLPIAEVAR